MPEKWTGRVVGQMHNERITHGALAKEMGVSQSYLSMILNGTRTPAGARERIRDAMASILEKRKGAPSCSK